MTLLMNTMQKVCLLLAQRMHLHHENIFDSIIDLFLDFRIAYLRVWQWIFW